VLLEPGAAISVKVGDKVKGGSSILAFVKVAELAGPSSRQSQQVTR
jgi:hypothetical protein